MVLLKWTVDSEIQQTKLYKRTEGGAVELWTLFVYIYLNSFNVIPAWNMLITKLHSLNNQQII